MQVCMCSRQILAVFRRSRLHDDGMTLNWAWNVQWPTDFKVFPGVLYAMDTRGIGEEARCLIDQNCIVFPTVPKGFGRVQKLRCAIVSNGVFDVAVFAEIECFLVHA